MSTFSWLIMCLDTSRLSQLVRDSQHLLLNGVLGDELVDGDIFGLAHPVCPVEALPLTVTGRVGSSEVETNTSSLQAQQQHLGGVRVHGLEGRHHLRPHHVAHGAIQPHREEEVLTEEWLEDGEEKEVNCDNTMILSPG